MRRKSISLTVLLFCLPFSAGAEPPSDAELQSLYLKSGLQTHVRQAPKSIQHGFDQSMASGQSGNAMSKHMISAISKSFIKAFVPETMETTILQELRQRLSREDARSALAWLESPLGTRITKLEEAASAPDTLEKVAQFGNYLKANPPAGDRLQIVGRLDKATRSTENTVEFVMATQLAMVVALTSVLPNDKPGSVFELRKAIEKSRSRIERVVKTQIRDYSLYAYRELTNSELEKYLNFVESDVGQRYYEATTSGMIKALMGSVLKLRTAIADEMQAQKI